LSGKVAIPKANRLHEKRREKLFFLDGDFGRFDYRENIVAFFQLHSLNGGGGNHRRTVPAAVRITTSDTTLSEMIFSIVPVKRLRMLVLICIYRIGKCKDAQLFRFRLP
jgi:hypothetical protein